jgi:hypothetical protein
MYNRKKNESKKMENLIIKLQHVEYVVVIVLWLFLSVLLFSHDQYKHKILLLLMSLEQDQLKEVHLILAKENLVYMIVV